MDEARPAGPTGMRFALAPSRIVRMPPISGPPAPAPPTPGVALELVAATVQKPAVAVTERPTETRRPYHVGVALGLTAGIYAGSLAAVSMLQFDHDRVLIADRRPVSDAIALLGRHHDEMAARLEQAGAVFGDASLRYDDLATGLQALHADVVDLSGKLAKINRLAAIDASGLGGVTRSGGTLPSVARSAPRSRGQSAPPPASATTGGSGAP
jgi:hypothetical protein